MSVAQQLKSWLGSQPLGSVLDTAREYFHTLSNSEALNISVC